MKRYAVSRAPRLFAAFLSLALLNFAVCPPRAAAREYVFGVVPQFEQRKLYATWKPIVDELEKRTGLTFRLVTTLQVPEFEKEFARGRFDFVYVNPYHIVQARKTRGYQPLVRDKVPLRGILVVKKDGPVRSVRDLDGKAVAFPSPNALGASLLMRADLEQVHHVTVTPLYVKTHSSVYLHVVQGLAAAGGGVEKTLSEQNQGVRDRLRVLYTTRALPSHPVAVHPRVNRQDAEKVRSALLAMGRDPAGKELLAKVPMTEPVATSMDAYLPMASWGLERYWKPIEGD